MAGMLSVVVLTRSECQNAKFHARQSDLEFIASLTCRTYSISISIP